jgi:hypothetical protein
MDPRNGLGRFVNGFCQLLGDGCDFCPTPELALMATRTFCFIDHQDFHAILLA